MSPHPSRLQQGQGELEWGWQPLSSRGSPPVPAMYPSGLEGRKPDRCLQLCFEHVSGFRSMFNKGNLTSTRRPESLWGCGTSTIGVFGAQWGQALLHHPNTTPQSAQLLQMSLTTSSVPPDPSFLASSKLCRPGWAGEGTKHKPHRGRDGAGGFGVGEGTARGTLSGGEGHREQGEGSHQGMGWEDPALKCFPMGPLRKPHSGLRAGCPCSCCLRRVFFAGEGPAAERAAVKG